MTTQDDPLSDVAVVIVTFNSYRDIRQCLDALPLSRLRKVVVVDNASQDNTCDVVRSEYSAVYLHLNDRNRGFGMACNMGAFLSGDVSRIVFLNPDASIDAHALTLLCDYMQRNERCALVAPRLTNGSTPISAAGGLATVQSELRTALPRRLARYIPDRRYDPDFDTSGTVGAVEGACMMVDADAFRTAGMFDPRFFLFFEEHDLARRLARIGRTVDLCASAWAVHAVGRSRESVPNQARHELVASTVRYIRRWYGFPAALGYAGIAATSIGSRAVLGVIPSWLARAWLSGLRHGLSRGQGRRINRG